MPRSISVIGWSTVLISIIMILTEFISLLSNPLEQFNVLINTFNITAFGRSIQLCISYLFSSVRFSLSVANQSDERFSRLRVGLG